MRVSIKEAARRLQCHPTRVRQMIRAGAVAKPVAAQPMGWEEEAWPDIVAAVEKAKGDARETRLANLRKGWAVLAKKLDTP